MMKRAASAAFAALVMSIPALAVNEGTAVGVQPEASSRLGNTERTLFVGSDVSVGETIATGPSGHVQLLFDDQTRIVVGPRSSLVIETYLLNGTAADRFAVNALAGTFRFISGTSPKPVYSIDTPTASIAVRGTEFDLTVGGGQNFVLLFEGALTLCQGDICVDLERRCDLGVVGGDDTGIYTWIDERRQDFVGRFPLPNIQSAFLRPFRVQGAQACLLPPPQQPSDTLIPSEPGQPAQRKR